MRVFGSTGFTGNWLRQAGKVRCRTTLLRSSTHAHADIVNCLL